MTRNRISAEIAKLEQEIERLLRIDTTLVDQMGDGAVHDQLTPAPVLLGVVVQARSAAA